MGEATEHVHDLYKKYGITDEEPGPPKRKKKQKSWIAKILERFRWKKKRKEITRPAGVRTPEQIAEWQDIMEIKKRKQQ